jgi:hypothetical protein
MTQSKDGDRLDRLEVLVLQFVTASGERITRIEEQSAQDRKETGDLRASIANLRDIAAGHERRLNRMEGREISWWGDMITLEERLARIEATIRDLLGGQT